MPGDQGRDRFTGILAELAVFPSTPVDRFYLAMTYDLEPVRFGTFQPLGNLLRYLVSCHVPWH